MEMKAGLNGEPLPGEAFHLQAWSLDQLEGERRSLWQMTLRGLDARAVINLSQDVGNCFREANWRQVHQALRQLGISADLIEGDWDDRDGPATMRVTWKWDTEVWQTRGEFETPMTAAALILEFTLKTMKPTDLRTLTHPTAKAG